jgi:hypothetical protein
MFQMLIVEFFELILITGIHTDLNFAKSKLKSTITLIEDGKVNALLYDNTKLISSHKLFGHLSNIYLNSKRVINVLKNI